MSRSFVKPVFIILCLAHVAISFNIAAIAAVLSTIAIDLRTSEVLAGRMISSYLVGYGLGALIYAPLLKFLSLRRLLMGALGVYAVSTFVSGSTGSISTLVYAQAVNGVAAASVVPLTLITIGKLFEKSVRGRLVGLFFSMSFAASIAGIAVSGLCSWRFLFWLPAVMSALVVIVLAIWNPDEFKQVRVARVNYGQALSSPALFKVFAFIFGMSLLYHGVHKWYGVLLYNGYGLEQRVVSFVILSSSVAGAAGQILGGYLSDKRGRYFACVVGGSVLGGATLLLGFTWPIPVVAAVMALISIGWTVGHNGVSAFLTDFPDEFRPEIASLNSAVRFVAGGLGFYLSSFVIGRSFAWNYFLIGALILALTGCAKKIVSRN